MEGRRGVFTYLSGIVRLIISIILVAIIAFFVVRWVRGRQDTKVAQQAASGEQQKPFDQQKSGGSNASNSSSDDRSSTGGSTTQSSPSVEVPGGFAQSEATPSQVNHNLPSAGLGSSTVLTALILSSTVYVTCAYLQSRAKISNTRF